MLNFMKHQENGTKGQKMDGKATQDAVGVISNEFHKFLADMEDLVKATNILTGEELTKAKAALSERISTAKSSLDGVSGDMIQHARKTAMDTNKYVHDRPWQVIGVGSAIGFVIGFLIARRS